MHTAPTRSFSNGTHNFAVYVEDDIGRSTIGVVLITVDDALPADHGTMGGLKSAWADCESRAGAPSSPRTDAGYSPRITPDPLP